MSTFNEIEMTTPYGDTDNVLELNIDSSSDAYVLQDVIKLPSTYTFSIWYRTESDSQITFNVLGESETVNSNTTWNKFVKTVTVETLDETSIYIIPSVGVNSYLYEGYLSEGITDTSWLPAPEDIEGEIGSVRSELRQTAESILLKVSDSNGRITTLETNLEGITTEISDAKGSSTTLQARLEGIDTSVVNAETSAKSFATQEAERIQSVVQNNIDNVESNINQRADSIEMSISSKQDTTGTAIRYIRDWLNGSNVDDENRWIECKVMSNDVDIAEGLIPVCNDLKHSNITIAETELSKYTDSLTLSSNYISSTGNHYLLLDLGEIYYDIDYIQVWHGYSEDKEYRYNHKLQISNDGITWFTLYDSSVSGGYSESSEGRIHYISSGTIISNMANMSLKLNEISSSVSKVDGELSEIKQQSDSITTTLGNNKEAIERLDNNFLELSTNVNSQNKSNADQFTKIIERISGVETRVGKTEGDITDISDVLQTADAWKAIFRHLGVDENIKETHISFDIDGITVTNPLNGQVTKMKIDGFSGWYNNEKVFWIENDTTKTIRLLCEKGWDTNFIKMTTNDYLYADGRHLKGTAYVKSGGTS